MSGNINQNDERKEIFKKLGKAYNNLTCEPANKYFTSDEKHMINDLICSIKK